MTTHDYGPLRTYEITWATGHIERMRGHQVSWPHAGIELPGIGITRIRGEQRVMVHGAFDGHWRLLLAAHPEDIRTIRDVTDGEWVAQDTQEPQR